MGVGLGADVEDVALGYTPHGVEVWAVGVGQRRAGAERQRQGRQRARHSAQR
jgi:hypothetical protein